MVRSSCSASSASPESARAAETAHVGDELAELVIRQRGAEGGHAWPPDGCAAVLDDLEEVLVRARPEAGAVGEVPGTDQEERGAPGAATIRAVARDAEPVEEPLAARGAARRPGRVEQGREARGEDTDRRDRENEDQQGAALRVILWSHFVPAYDAWLDDFAKKWGEQSGVTVRIDHIPHLELPTRYAAEFAAGTGHDLIYFAGQILTGQYYRHLVDLSDLANDLGTRYGPWMPSAKSAAQVAGVWYAVPDYFISIPVLWRKDLFESVGRPAPKTWDDLRVAARLLRPKGHPTGMQFSHCNDANHNWRALLYCFGAKE